MIDTHFKYELFFELSPDLLCIAGYDGYFKKINSAVSELLGYSMEELYSRPINDFVYQEDQEITSKVRTALTQQKPLHNFENRYVTKAGEIVWLAWTSQPVDSDQLIFAIAKNITHKKKLEVERNALISNLTKVNQDLKQLNYTTSHDLRSPVNNLLALFTMIDTSRINDQETIEVMEILQLAGENLKQTLNNYVDLLQEKQTEGTSLQEVHFTESLSSVLASINCLIKTSKATIHAEFSKAPKVKFDEAYLRSVFLNLITNSIKYARPDCPPVITIHSEKSREATRLIVSDNGIGFDPERMKEGIFERHQKSHRHTDSKGIGLSLVHNHVTSLGGKITVESKVDEGTRFMISFKD